MLEDMDDMEARWDIYIMIGMFNQCERTKMCILTVTTLGIVMQNVQHDLICRVCFM